jgi:hypothetical protein
VLKHGKLPSFDSSRSVLKWLGVMNSPPVSFRRIWSKNRNLENARLQ